MNLVLYGISAVQWWRRSLRSDGAACLLGGDVLVDAAPTMRSASYLLDALPFAERPVHVLTGSSGDKRSIPNVVTHSSSYAFPKGSFACVADGLYVPSPELSLIQTALTLPVLDALEAGYALCGRFAEGAGRGAGLRERVPVTTLESIRCFARANARLRGSSKMLALLPYIKEGSASPRESMLALCLMLPYRLGGFGLDGALMNERIDVSVRARKTSGGSYYVADLCWPREKLIVEYDSDLHLTSEQLAHDAKRRGALETDGYAVVTVNRVHLRSIDEMTRIAMRIARRLGRRFRPRSACFERKQAELFEWIRRS